MAASDDPRRGGFSFGQLGEEFDEEFTNTVRNLCDIERAKIISPENVAHYSHGHQWLELEPQGGMTKSGFETHSHEGSLQLEDIRLHRIEVIPRHVTAVVTEMSKQFTQMMYAEVAEGADAVGNTVDAKQFESPALAFLEGLKRLEFGVDRQGNPSRPQLHLGQAALEALQRDFEKHGKPLQDKIEEITKQKEREAVERNKSRLRRFKGYKDA